MRPFFQKNFALMKNKRLSRNQFLKKLDQILGSLFCFILPRKKKVADTCFPRKLRSILFIRPGGIGDAVLLIPSIRSIKSHFPDLMIDILAEKRNVEIFALSTDVRKILRYDRFTDFVEVIRGRYDVVIDSEQWYHLSAVVAFLIRSRMKIGFETNDRRNAFTHPISYSHDVSEVDSFYRLLEPLGVHASISLAFPFLTLPERVIERADELLRPLMGSPFIALFPGASIPERRWGVEKLASLARKVREAGFDVVIVGGTDDLARGALIAAAGDGLNLAGVCSLPESAAVIARSKLLVSGDSGILHVGYGLGRPTVSLFGPGIAKKWAPVGEKHIVINRNMPCSPCTRFGNTPECSIGTRCLQDIAVEEVTAAVMTLLHRKLEGTPT